jgi:hypothetical protein
MRLLRRGNLRHEAAAVLLGLLPVQGEAEAGEGRERYTIADGEPANTISP